MFLSRPGTSVGQIISAFIDPPRHRVIPGNINWYQVVKHRLTGTGMHGLARRKRLTRNTGFSAGFEWRYANES